MATIHSGSSTAQSTIEKLRQVFGNSGDFSSILFQASKLGSSDLNRLGIDPTGLREIQSNPEFYSNYWKQGPNPQSSGNPVDPMAGVTLRRGGSGAGGSFTSQAFPGSQFPGKATDANNGSMAFTPQTHIPQSTGTSGQPQPMIPGHDQFAQIPTQQGQGVGNPLSNMFNWAQNLTSGIQSNVQRLAQPQMPVANTVAPSINLPSAPSPYNFQMHDFTDQANKAAASAYAPQYAALQSSRNNAQTQYGQSDQVVKGIYDNLTKSDAQRATESGQRYAGEQKAQAASGQQLQNTIGGTYDKAANSEAQLLKSLGIEAAAPSVLQAGASDKAFNQAQAATQTAAQGSALGQEGQAQQAYNTNMQGADQTQGGVARQGLVNQLNNVLQQYDAQKQDISGQQSQQALALASQLQSQDMTLQDKQAGAQQNQYSNALQAAQAQLAQENATNALANAGADRQLQFQGQQQAASQFQQQQKYQSDQAANALAQQNWQNQFDVTKNEGQLGLGKYQTDMQYGGGNSAAAQRQFNMADPMTKFLAQGVSSGADPDGALGNVVNQVAQGYSANLAAKGANLPDFIAQVIKNAPPGADLTKLATVATAYWHTVLGKQG